MARFPKRSETKTRVAHALAGFTISIEGFERLEEQEFYAGAAMALLGVTLILFGLFHSRLHHSRFSEHLETAAFVIEAIVLGLIALVYFHHGKKLLPWLYAALVIAYLTITVVRHLRQRVRVAG